MLSKINALKYLYIALIFCFSIVPISASATVFTTGPISSTGSWTASSFVPGVGTNTLTYNSGLEQSSLTATPLPLSGFAPLGSTAAYMDYSERPFGSYPGLAAAISSSWTGTYIMNFNVPLATNTVSFSQSFSFSVLDTVDTGVCVSGIVPSSQNCSDIITVTPGSFTTVQDGSSFYYFEFHAEQFPYIGVTQFNRIVTNENHDLRFSIEYAVSEVPDCVPGSKCVVGETSVPVSSTMLLLLSGFLPLVFGGLAQFRRSMVA